MIFCNVEEFVRDLTSPNSIKSCDLMQIKNLNKTCNHSIRIKTFTLCNDHDNYQTHLNTHTVYKLS